ncbi:hypothetical protein FRX31_022839 [Thalictrum thalictroides]|uniref:Uncharacterized protein n=1 Tax=Thalictrum thalictroides TaxID=46969 RepID=A0A7J6VS73_THATH|nr:hypothetical protein FRX31_022839 [Thalictrum thalictroides]
MKLTSTQSPNRNVNASNEKLMATVKHFNKEDDWTSILSHVPSIKIDRKNIRQSNLLDGARMQPKHQTGI